MKTRTRRRALEEEGRERKDSVREVGTRTIKTRKGEEEAKGQRAPTSERKRGTRVKTQRTKRRERTSTARRTRTLMRTHQTIRAREEGLEEGILR